MDYWKEKKSDVIKTTKEMLISIKSDFIDLGNYFDIHWKVIVIELSIINVWV